MYKLYEYFNKYKNYRKNNMKKKMKPIIVQYYLKQIYAGKVKNLQEFMIFVENKYIYFFKNKLKSYLDIFIELILSSINK